LKFLSSIPRPEFDLERGLAPNPAPLTAQLPLKRHQARIARPALQQHGVQNDRLVPAGVAAGAYVMEDAQVLGTGRNQGWWISVLRRKA
jgi:hypothetical protein